mgnify:CR=1 FL=1
MELRTISPHRGMPSPAPPAPPPPPSQQHHSAVGALNLSTPRADTDSSLDLTTTTANAARSVTPRSDTSKMSPFSTEALLSRPNSRKESPKTLPPLNLGIKGILESERTTPTASLASPWHAPASKPAVPLSPVVRSSAPPMFGVSLPSGLAGLPGLSTETTFSSLNSVPSTSLQPPSSSASSTANLYLQAMMGAAAQQKPQAASVGLNSLDPLSQYYAAMYSQQLSAYNAAALGPYAASLSAAAGLGGGLGSASALAGLAGGSSSGLSAAALSGSIYGIPGLGGASAASQFAGLTGGAGAAQLAGLTGLTGAAGAAQLAGLTGLTGAAQAAQLAGMTGLTGLTGASAQLAGLTSGAAGLGGVSQMPATSQLSRSVGGYGSASAELQALQAYKDLMNRSSQALPPTTAGGGGGAAAANPYAALYAGLLGYPGLPRKDQ